MNTSQRSSTHGLRSLQYMNTSRSRGLPSSHSPRRGNQSPPTGTGVMAHQEALHFQPRSRHSFFFCSFHCHLRFGCSLKLFSHCLLSCCFFKTFVDFLYYIVAFLYLFVIYLPLFPYCNLFTYFLVVGGISFFLCLALQPVTMYITTDEDC